MRILKQSTGRDIVIFMTDAADHISGKTGLTLTITASKNGAAFASISPTVTELVNGWYKLALTTSHTDTLGDLALHITGTDADPTDVLMQVAPGLPGVTDTNNDKSNYSLSSAGVQAIWDKATTLLVGVGSIGKLLVDNIDAAISSRLASGSYTAPDNASITAIKAKTDNLPATPASQGDVTTVGTAVAAVDTLATAIKAKTDNLPAAPAATGDVTTVGTAVDAVNTLATAIKAKTDNLPAAPAGKTFRTNEALAGFTFPMVDSEGSPATGLTVVAKRSIDGAAFALCANSVSEISSGFYKIDLAAADLNGKVIALEFSATGAITTKATVVAES